LCRRVYKQLGCSAGRPRGLTPSKGPRLERVLSVIRPTERTRLNRRRVIAAVTQKRMNDSVLAVTEREKGKKVCSLSAPSRASCKTSAVADEERSDKGLVNARS